MKEGILISIVFGAACFAATIATCTGLCVCYWRDYNRKRKQQATKNDEEGSSSVNELGHSSYTTPDHEKYVPTDASVRFGCDVLKAFKGREEKAIVERKNKLPSEGAQLPIFARSLG